MNQLESDFQMLVALLETLQPKWVKVSWYLPYYVPQTSWYIDLQMIQYSIE
jgi:hypothetical protein